MGTFYFTAKAIQYELKLCLNGQVCFNVCLVHNETGEGRDPNILLEMNIPYGNHLDNFWKKKNERMPSNGFQRR